MSILYYISLIFLKAEILLWFPTAQKFRNQSRSKSRICFGTGPMDIRVVIQHILLVFLPAFVKVVFTWIKLGSSKRVY